MAALLAASTSTARITVRLRRAVPAGGHRRPGDRAAGLQREGFRTVHVLATEEEVAAAAITRTRLYNDLRHESGPFDAIGDVHGCRAELEALLTGLGYASERDGAGPALCRGPAVLIDSWQGGARGG